jgi:hypothetical protein
VSIDDALDRALKTSSLTTDGKPFHAIVDIGKPVDEYSGRVEVWWAAPAMYRLQITSPKFSQLKVVNGDAVSEKNDGDYYPRWLENFVLAILDPIPNVQNFRGRGGVTTIGGNVVSGCILRDDRPGGITDQMTWGQICLMGDEPRVKSVAATNFSLEYKDWQKFDKKQIARTVTSKMRGRADVVGYMTSLEELKADPGMFDVKDVTPLEQRIATGFVSTLTEESILEKAPVIEWPAVLDGKTEGYMIVYARTDRTGQVRETAKINSDQNALEDVGIDQALRYKFKPLIKNGVPAQMEMPLVLHFVTAQENGLPVLSVEQMRKQMGNCQLNVLPEKTPAGTTVRVRVSVNERGELTGVAKVSDVPLSGWLAAALPLQSCHFAPLAVNGKSIEFKGDIELTAH